MAQRRPQQGNLRVQLLSVVSSSGLGTKRSGLAAGSAVRVPGILLGGGRQACFWLGEDRGHFSIPRFPTFPQNCWDVQEPLVLSVLSIAITRLLP